MRTTVRIDDDLLRELKQRAASDDVSLSHLLNQVLRRGLAAKTLKRGTFRQKTHAMGEPRLNLDKALALAAELEEHEVAAKLAARK